MLGLGIGRSLRSHGFTASIGFMLLRCARGWISMFRGWLAAIGLVQRWISGSGPARLDSTGMLDLTE